MSYLTRLSLQLGAVVMIAVVILFAGGIWAASQLKQDLLPDISFPAYVVIVPYPGAGPSVVDTQVTQPLGSALQSVSGVSHVNSTSSQGASIVEVEFSDGVDPNRAEQDVNSAVDKVRPSLPQVTRAPTVQAFSTDQLPILEYSVVADEPMDQLAGQLSSIAVPKLKGLAGVSSVQVAGGATQEVQVTVDAAKLAQHGLTMSQVAQALQGASLVQSVGTIQDGGRTVPVQVSSALTSVDQINQVLIPVGASSAGTGGAGAGGGQGTPGGEAGGAAGSVAGAKPSGPPVKVGDVASVKVAAVPSDTITRTDGKPSIGLNILKTPSANTVQVANAVKDALPDVRSRIGHGVAFTAMQDNATPVTDAIGSILREGLLGALFAVVVIFAFLRSMRATVVAAVSIPLSLLVALLMLWWQNITLNILTLGGMTVAIGRVVDDAIVVLENISRHVQSGRPPRRAALSGAREIVTAVTSSTLTTVAVFLPIAFLTGIAGQFFRPFALTVVAALLASLVVAVTVVPLFASRLLKVPRRPGVDRFAELLQRIYVPVIRWATGHRLLTVVVAVLLLVGSLALVPKLRVNLLDESSQPTFTISLTMPDNSTLAQTDTEVQRVENMVRSVRNVKAYEATVGGSKDPFAPPGTVPADPTTASVLVLIDKQNHAQVQSDVQHLVDTYSGPAKVSVGAAEGSSTGSGVQLSVKAPNASTLQTANDRVLSALGKVNGLSDVKSNLAASKPQYVLTPTPALASSGLTLQTLAALVGQAVGGQVATQAQLPQGRLDVRVQLPPGAADSPSALQGMQVPTAGGVVPLSALATLQRTQGPQSVLRVDGNETATITATMTGNDTRVVQQRVTDALNGVSLPDGASVSTGGVFDQLNTVLTQFVLAILGAIALVYLIMVATFRSLLKPLVLLVSIPFAAIGAILALVVTDTALSLPGLIGLLMLTGIVVTNAIVLLDLVEQYRERGLSVKEALIEGGRHRLRPILMTAIATMLALIPMAVSGDTGGGFIGAPLAIVVIGGLCSSTLLTLILVPVLYSLVARFTRSRADMRIEESDEDRAPVEVDARAPRRAEHPLVTVFAAAGLSPRPIAEQVAARLEVPVLDLGGSVDQLASALESALADEDASKGALTQLLSRLGAASDSDGRSAFRTQLREAVLRLGARSGGVVVSPVGAVVLSDRPGGLHVRLVAPMERRLSAARREDESEEDTRKRLDDIDRERAASVRDEYGVDLNDPRLYQLTLDPTVFPLESCVDLIATAAETALQEPAAPPVRTPVATPAR